MRWNEVRSQFDKFYGNQATDDELTEHTIDPYQAELLKLYDRWTGVNTKISLHSDSM